MRGQGRHTSKHGALRQLVDDHGGQGEAQLAIRANQELSNNLYMITEAKEIPRSHIRSGRMLSDDL